MAVEVEIDVQVLKSRRGAAGRTGFTLKPSSWAPVPMRSWSRFPSSKRGKDYSGAMIGR